MSLDNFSYHPGYDLENLEAQSLVENPEVKIIKKTVKGIKERIGRLLNEKQRTKNKLQKRKDARLDKK